MLGEATRSLPLLNKQMFAITDLRELTRIAAGFGVRLRAEPFPKSAASLRGLYFPKRTLAKSASIWLNTRNHHPVAVASAFWHELGHHIADRMSGLRAPDPLTFFKPGYQDHLNDELELAADIVMVLAAYPRSAAKRLFPGSDGKQPPGDAEALILRVRPFIQSAIGFDFSHQVAIPDNLKYLAGMLHIAKLRQALFLGYGI